VRFGQDLGDLRKDRALGVVFLAGRDHGRDVEDLCHLGQRNRLLGREFAVDVLDQLHRADLMVYQQQGGVVGGESFDLHGVAPVRLLPQAASAAASAG
jgi:hypothetical protein